MGYGGISFLPEMHRLCGHFLLPKMTEATQPFHLPETAGAISLIPKTAGVMQPFQSSSHAAISVLQLCSHFSHPYDGKGYMLHTYLGQGAQRI